MNSPSKQNQLLQSSVTRITTPILVSRLKSVGFSILLLLASGYAFSQPPKRRALIGIQSHESVGGLLIDSVFANSTMHRAGIKKSDLLTKINDRQIQKLSEYADVVKDLRMDDHVTVSYTRKGKTISRSVVAVMKPLETSSTADIGYDWVKFKNGYLRMPMIFHTLFLRASVNTQLAPFFSNDMPSRI